MSLIIQLIIIPYEGISNWHKTPDLSIHVRLQLHMAVTVITFLHTARASGANGIWFNVHDVVFYLVQREGCSAAAFL